MNDKRCENCRFWKPKSDDSYEGLCRRYPPRLNLAVLEEEAKAGRETTEVPLWAWTRCQTAADDWCGEWQSNNPVTPPRAAPVPRPPRKSIPPTPAG